jgi:hypothetical protein
MPGAQALIAVPAAALTAAAAVAAGCRLRRWLRTPVEPGLRLPVDWSLGSLAIGAAVVVLGVLGLWSPWTLVGVVVAALVTGRWRRRGYRWSALVPGVVGAAVTVPIALAPPFFYDALVYHLGLPWQAILEHGLHAHPEDLFAAFPPLAQLLYAPLLALGVERAPALLHWASFVVAATAVGVLAQRLGAPRWAAFLAAACVPVLPCAVLVAGLPAAEGWLIASTVLAAALIARRRWPPGTGALLGLLLGGAVAVRLQGIPWAAILIGCALLRTRSVRTIVSAAAAWLCGSAVWWGKNLITLGDPTAPVFFTREGIDTLWRDSGSAMHTAHGAAGFAQATLGALAPHAAYIGPLALAALIAVAADTPARHRLVAGAAVAGLLAWALSGNLPRFLTVVAALLLALAASAAGRSAAGRWAAALAIGTAATLGLVVSVAQLHRWGALGLAVTPPAAARERLVVDNPFPAFAAAARVLPDGARVLFVGEPRGFGFPRRFAAPSQHDVSPLRAILEAGDHPAAAAAALRRRGFTHLLVNFAELARLAPSYPVAPWRGPAGWRRWNVFVSSLGPPLVSLGSVEIFALDGGSPPPV